MKKIILFYSFLHWSFVFSSLVDFFDESSKNRFLGLDRSMCTIVTKGSGGNYQKSYDCGNSSISELLNVNFLSDALFGQQLYIYNDFMYWIGKNLQSGNKNAVLNAQPDNNFSGSGIFMIILGTTPYLKDVVAPKMICSQGESLIMAQLKYNDGNSIALWSQDALCLAPTDSFTVTISSDEDNSVVSYHSGDDFNAEGVDLMKDEGPSVVYKKATGSPRKIRLNKK